MKWSVKTSIHAFEWYSIITGWHHSYSQNLHDRNEPEVIRCSLWKDNVYLHHLQPCQTLLPVSDLAKAFLQILAVLDYWIFLLIRTLFGVPAVQQLSNLQQS